MEISNNTGHCSV